MTDKKKVAEAVKLLLEAIGEDTGREGLLETPDRVARMFEEITAGYEEDASAHLSKQFDCTGSDMVIERDISFFSTCEHHLLPFFGKVHIAYIPNGHVVGLSKLARTVEVFARRLQLQERLTAQIADAVEAALSPKGVFVVIEAEHMCMSMRGIKKPGSTTVTTAARGAFDGDTALCSYVLSQLK